MTFGLSAAYLFKVKIFNLTLYCYVLISLTSLEYCKHAKHCSHVSTDTRIMCSTCNVRQRQEGKKHNLWAEWRMIFCIMLHNWSTMFFMAWKDSFACCQIQITVTVAWWGKLNPERWQEGLGLRWHRQHRLSVLWFRCLSPHTEAVGPSTY